MAPNSQEAQAQGEYTKDGSMDLKGKPILRSKSGGWTACSFIIGNLYICYILSLLIYNLFSSSSHTST